MEGRAMASSCWRVKRDEKHLWSAYYFRRGEGGGVVSTIPCDNLTALQL